jgi:hypothetical protein
MSVSVARRVLSSAAVDTSVALANILIAALCAGNRTTTPPIMFSTTASLKPCWGFFFV